jgi:hypothetical protein
MYGTIAAVTAENRIPLVRLAARQTPVTSKRRDKTGSRTFAGLPNRLRKDTTFRLNTLMTSWTNSPAEPGHGPLFRAALGGAPLFFGGGGVSSMASQTQVSFTAAHGLAVGQGVTCGGEMRFVTGVMNDTTIAINAPFSVPPADGAVCGPTVTYPLATDLMSASIHDYWDPAEAVQRIVHGAAMDTMKVKINGDFHEFEFSGSAKDIVDSTTFEAGQGALNEFPTEPSSIGFDYSVVPGHLGQVWMGSAPSRMLSLTSAELTVENNIDLRAREFGSDSASCITAGQRVVRLNFSIFEQDDEESRELYQASRQRSPIEVMFQLGEQQGQLFGVYMPAMVPEMPQFSDSDNRLEWAFDNSQAQGTIDDELYVAFG